MDKYTFVYTKCLDAADGHIETKVLPGLTRDHAQACFRNKVRDLLDAAMENMFCKTTIRLSAIKALVKIEGVHHVVAVTKDS